jgi:hypothetical protein
MAGIVKVKIHGLKEMQSAFKRSPKIVADEINSAIKKSILSILARAVPKMPVDTNFLRSRNVTIFSKLMGKLENRAPYAIFVHEGTKPHFPPLHAIERWANRHGIPPFLVARAIARKGTKGKPFYDIAVKESQTLINHIFSRALDNITIKLAK